MIQSVDDSFIVSLLSNDEANHGPGGDGISEWCKHFSFDIIVPKTNNYNSLAINILKNNW